MIDVAGLIREDLSLDDFDFLVGNTVDPEQWLRLSDSSDIPLPTLTIIDGPAPGTTRLVLDFPDNAIQDAWLQVTLKANGTTGLANDDTFYFGSLIGNTIDGNLSPGQQAVVNSGDSLNIVSNTGNTTLATRNLDIDRDGQIDNFDAALTRAYADSVGLRMFAAPASTTFGQLGIEFTEPEAVPFSPESLSRQQKNFLDTIFTRFENRLAPDLTTQQRNNIVADMQLNLAEIHAQNATNFEARGLTGTAEYWSTIALAERAFVNELQSSSVDFRELGNVWTA